MLSTGTPENIILYIEFITLYAPRSALVFGKAFQKPFYSSQLITLMPLLLKTKHKKYACQQLD
jgi:hypothetical protein